MSTDMRGWVPTLSEATLSTTYGDLDEPCDRHYDGDIAVDPCWWWIYRIGPARWIPLTPVVWS
jgi:hypothetical protein